MAAAALLVAAVPLTRDWSAEVNRLAGLGQHALGLDIAIDGKPRLALLPPALTMDKVRLSRDGAALGQIGRLSVRLSPWSLLSGRVEPAALALDHVELAGLRLDGLEARLGHDRVDGFTKLHGHTVTFAASLDQAAGRAAAFRLSIPTLGASLRFDGTLENGAGGPVLSGHASLNSGPLAALLPHLSLPPAAALRAGADLDLGDGQLALVNLTVESNGSRASGSVLALAGSPTLVEADLEIDRLDLDSWQGGASAALPALLSPALTPPATAAAPAIAGATAAAAPNGLLASDLLANLRLGIATLSWHGQAVHGIDIQAGLDQGMLVLRHAQARLGKDVRLNLDGTLEGTAFAGRLRLNGPGLSGRADLRAIHGDAGLAAELNNLHLNRDGSFAKGRLAGRWHGGVMAEWQGEIGAWKDTALAARLRPTAHGFEADDLSLRVGLLSLHGQASADLAGIRPRIDARLRGDVVDLATLPASPVAAAPVPAPRPGGKTTPPRPPAVAAQPARKGGSPFSAAPLDWSSLEAVDGTLHLAANALDGTFGRLEQASLKLVLNNGTATLEKLHADYLGGTLDAHGAATSRPEPSLRLEATVKGLDLARLKPELAGLSAESGRLDGHMRLHSSGKSRRDMAANAQGEGRVDGVDGSVAGIDLAAIDGQLARIDTIGNVLALVQTGLAGGRTPFSRLSGHLSVKDGIARSPDLTLVASGGTVRADLSVNLTRWTTDSSVSLALASLAETPITLRLSGSMDAPRKVVDANALQKALVRGGLGRALGTAAADGTKGGRDTLRNLLRAFGGDR